MKPLYIVDASVVIKWTFDDEDHVPNARTVLSDFLNGSIDLVAPDHLHHEVLNTLRTGVVRQRIALEDARLAMQHLLDLRIPVVAGPALYLAGFDTAFSYGCAYYDALYLALSNDSGARFVHADRRLRNTLGGRFTHELWIEEYPFDESRYV